ncbi:HAD hydrolase-like protein [Gammaproteobacteria bacterium]|jgi:FMN phosphatase YigB (HAD superfamily)|nr:HAD hydrolase-like protein [Gammaproteobacteria bacterium]
MVKLNSTTAILSDLDGVILDLSYDIKFWELWLPEHVADQNNQSIEEAQEKIQAEIDAQRGTLNFYDLNYWDDLLDVDCMQIIKAKEERCSYLKGSNEALQKLSVLKNPKHILTNGDPRVQEYKAEIQDFLKFFDSIFYSMHAGYPKEQKEFWALARHNLNLDFEDAIFIDDDFKVVTAAVKAGIKQVIWITPGKKRILQNGIGTFPSLKDLVAAIT